MNVVFNYSIDQYRLSDELNITIWIEKVISKENKLPGDLFYNFVEEEEILEINKSHLNHDYFTDIISFDNSFVNIISGELFISPDTIKYNSEIFNLPYLRELYRVIIHGIMHLCGYKDSTTQEKLIMRGLEDKYLSYLEKL